MPGVYKKKECPQCHLEHRKRGPFCSQACHNRYRDVTDETKQKISEKAKEYYRTPEGVAKKSLFSLERSGEIRGVSIDDFAVDIPSISDYELPPGYDIADDW